VCIVERRHALASGVFAVASVATLFGIVHSPLPNGALFWPWAAGAAGAVALPLAGAYGVAAATCWLASGGQDR
jgi:AGZA family xanthine/uracil permease-like MFS transporter